MLPFLTPQRCRACKARVQEGVTVCPVCGATLGGAKVSEHCPFCGARYAPGDTVCLICGAPRASTGPRRPRRIWPLLALIGIVALLGLGLWQAPRLRQEVGLGVLAGAVEKVASQAQVLLEIPSLSPSPTEIPPTPTRTWTKRPTATPTITPSLAVLLPSATPPSASLASVEGTPTPIPPTEQLTITPTGPVPTPGPRVHVVQKGDILGRIALQYGVTVKEIAALNGISEDTILRLGQELLIPPAPQTEVQVALALSPSPAPTSLPVPTPTFVPTATPTPLGQGLAGLAGLTLIESERKGATATLTPTVTPTPRVHIVAKGDTLGRIALLYDVSAARIAEANGITLETMLQIGQVLRIPGEGEEGALLPEATPTSNRTPLPSPTPTLTPVTLAHTVAKGDTLGGIAVRYGVPSAEIAKANGITERTLLQIGQVLIIPLGTGTSAQTTPIPTETPTSTPSPTPSPSPTLTRLPTPAFRYRAPTPLWPTNGAYLRGADVLPLLNWTSVGILAEDEWYRLRVWGPGERETPVVFYTKATSYRLTERVYPQGRRLRQIYWDITVVRLAAEGTIEIPQSPASEEHVFTWR